MLAIRDLKALPQKFARDNELLIHKYAMMAGIFFLIICGIFNIFIFNKALKVSL